MAKTVKPFELRLKVLGDEAVKKLGSSFRELDKALDISNSRIKQLRNEVLGYNKEGQQSEQLIKGQITALKALQAQTTVNSRLYQKLGNNVSELKAKLIGTTTSVEKQRLAILQNVKAQKLSSAATSRYVDQLKKLQKQTVENSQASQQFEQDIVSLTQKMRELKRQEIGQLGKGTVEFTKGATTNIGRLINRLGDLGRASRTALGAWTRTVEGIGAAGAVGVAAKGVSGAGLMATGAAQGASGGLLNYLLSSKESLTGLPVLGDKLANLIPDAAINKVAELTASIASLDGQLDAVNQAAAGVTSTLGQIGPAGAAAGIAAGTGIAFIFDLIKKRSDKAKAELDSVIQSIDDNVQKTLVSLSRLENQMSGSRIAGLLGEARAGFAATPAGSYRSRSMASQIAGLEALGAQEAAAQADVLERYRQRVRGTREDAQALGERLAYVQGKLKTLDQTTEEGRAEFAQFSNEAISLTDKLQKLGDGYRHVSTMAAQAATAQENAVNAAVRLNYLNFGAAQAQRQAMAELGQRVQAGVAGTRLALPAAGQTTAAGTGQAISGGARRLSGQVETTFDQPRFRIPRTIGIRAGYFSPSTADVGQPAAVGMSEAAIGSQAAAAKKAAMDLTQYRTAIRQAREANTGSIASTNNLRQALVAMRDQLDPTGSKFRALTREIERLDAQSAKYALNQRKRGFGRNVRAGVGSALSGAVFGGPEAAIGGLVGGLAGGIAGGAAGAGLGAQASMLRQSIAGTTEYAAQLAKMRIALKGVAGGQAEYEKALSISGKVTDRFNVSQAESITGMTRLTAAVTGAGGKVYDAGLVFENVTAAIKATGGSTEDVNSAIVAMVQVFSKGKVSAEELSGQLGERLPGAVTLFAKANNMSLTELQKNLKNGTVGLNELMNFVIELGKKYGDTADQISGSGEEAGARLQVLINDLRADLGKALQPVGEELQNTFAEFLKTNREAITKFVKDLSQALLDLVKVLKEAGPELKALGRALLIAGVVGGVSKAFAGLTAAFGRFNAKSALTLIRFGKVNKAVKRLRLSAAKPIVFTIALIGLDAIIQASNEIKRLRKQAGQKVEEEKAFEAETYIKGLGGAAQTRDVFERQLKEVQAAGTKANETLLRANEQVKKFESYKIFGETGDTLTGTLFNVLTGIEAAEQNARLQAKGAMADVDKTFKQQAALIKQIPLAKPPTASDFASPEDDGGGKSGKDKVFMAKEELELRRQIREASLQENALAEALAVYRLDIFEADKEREDIYKRQDMKEEARLKFEQALLDYKDKQNDLDKERDKLQREFNAGLQDRQYELGLITEKEYNRLLIERERARLKEAYPDLNEGQREQMVELKRREVDPTFAEGLQSSIKNLKDELKELTDPVNALVNGATAIGNAFSTSFTNVISGSQSAKEALADFFKNIGNYFLDLASQIISKMIVIAALNALAQILPTTKGGGGFKGDSVDQFNASARQYTLAEGGYVMGGFNAFANGGVVSKPTLGLVGEGGEPEYIIPASKMRGAMKRYSAGARGSGVIPGNGEQGAPTLGGAGVEGGPIDVRYTVERINSVDYVTADQFRTGMSEAAQRGAVQGEQRTLRRLQMSTSTRKRLGM